MSYANRKGADTNQPGDGLVKIYALLDPESNAVRYIGKTAKALEARLHVHLAVARRGNKTHRCNWLRSVLASGQRPLIKLIEEVGPEGDWQAREQFWIALSKQQGASLTNATAGGEGWHGLTHSDSAKQKIGQAHKGKVISAAQREAQSNAMRGRTLTDEHKRKVSVAMTGRVVGAETRAKLSAAQARKPAGIQAGERNPRAKITAAQASAIRSSTEATRVLVARYQLSDTTIRAIQKGKLWK